MNAATATLYGALIAGVFALLGAVVGLLVERLVRRLGKVQCVIEEGDWNVQQDPSSILPEDSRRLLRVTFLNRKDVPVTVWDMRVEFYKGGEPLNEEDRPSMQFYHERGNGSAGGPVALPPHIPVPLTLSVLPRNRDNQRVLEEVDRAEFVATLGGARDPRKELPPPWRPR